MSLLYWIYVIIPCTYKEAASQWNSNIFFSFSFFSFFFCMCMCMCARVTVEHILKTWRKRYENINLHPCSFQEQPELSPPSTSPLNYRFLTEFWWNLGLFASDDWAYTLNCRGASREFFNKFINSFLRWMYTFSWAIINRYEIG